MTPKLWSEWKARAEATDARVRELEAENARLRGEQIIAPDAIASVITDLRALRDGWLDGEGLAPDSETLDWLERALPRWVAVGMPMPRLYPTVDGYVRVEWPIGDDGLDASAEFHAALIRRPGAGGVRQ